MTNMPKFNPMNTSGPPPLISREGDRMAARSRSRNWQNTTIAVSDGQAAFEEGVENGMENDPGMQYEFDDFLNQADEERRNMAGRSFGQHRSRLRS